MDGERHFASGKSTALTDAAEALITNEANFYMNGTVNTTYVHGQPPHRLVYTV